jgi:catechol 2,3-dioxygenase-like lactoylglutathione lyase family enzyme
MKTKVLLVAGLAGVSFAPWLASQSAEPAPLPPPHFHHLHLNSTNPDAAIDFYMKAFPSTSRTTYAGLPALKAGNVYVLFTKVSSAPALQPQTAIWHFGWHVTDERKTYDRYVAQHIPLLPLYTDDTGKDFVYISSDALPGASGTLGRTKAQLAEAKAQGLKPVGGAGFAYIAGPDGAMIEYQGNMPAERFNHVHMYQENPFCAQLWYEKHLDVPHQGRGPAHTEADCKVARSERSWPALEKEGTSRQPTAAVAFDDVALPWYMNQNDTPLVSTRGHLADHFALSVPDLDAWTSKLKRENVTFLEQVHKLGDTRAIMIEGPSKEAIEILEVK